MKTIRNNHLEITVSPLGAELQSIRSAEGKEYLWQGDARFWGRRSPILFPIVGGLWRDVYRVGEAEYSLPRHGFARNEMFQLVEETDRRLDYELTDNAQTMACYPYRFGLRASYELDGNVIHVRWRVHNRDRRRIYFSIGGHPAFYVPGATEETGPCGTLRLVPSEEARSAWWLERATVGNDGCLHEERLPVYTDADGALKCDEETFSQDALVFDRSQLRSVEILKPDGGTLLSVEFEAPAVGIWSPYGKHAPFVCIEPWYGVTDRAGFDGQLRDKYLINCVQPGAAFQGGYDIRICDVDASSQEKTAR